MLKFFDGKVIPLSPQNANLNRYSILGLESVEPNLGAPSGNSYMLVGDTDGTRSWVPSSSLPNAYIPKSIVNDKGDIIVGVSSNNLASLPASTNGYVLTTDSTQPLGIKWSPGTPGPPGQPGPTGDDAYEVAVAAGFVGTREQWLASLVGPEGPGGVISSVDVPFTSPIVAANATADFTVTLGKVSQLNKVSLSHPCWLRLFRSASQRSSDTRLIPGGTLQGIINMGDNKPYGEFVTTTTPETIICNPPAGILGDNSGLVYIRLINQSGSTRAITGTLTITPFEV